MNLKVFLDLGEKHIITKIAKQACACGRARYGACWPESENTYNKPVTLAVDFSNQTETEINRIDLLWLLSKKVQYILPFSGLLMFSF